MVRLIMIRVITATLALAVSLLAQSPGAEQIAQIFAAYQHADTPGCAVGIDAPGHDTWTAAYGMADLEHAVANTPTTVFEVGSVSKQFTAAAVLLLVERGQLSLDDNIRKYFPEIPEYERPITIRELLNHTSGLRDWGEIEEVAGWPRTTRVYTHAHVLDVISRQRSLNYLPGETWSYTNSGYNLSAMLVERVSGMKLQAFCRKEFFDPLGMSSTQWRDDFRRVVPNRAIAYDLDGSEWRQNMPFEDVYGNGGLLSTVGDMLNWNRNLASGKLHPDIFKQMQTPGTLNDGARIGYGFGLFLADFEGLAEVSHSGATAGYRAWLGRFPSNGFTVAMICNAGSANTTDLAHQIARLYLGLPKPQRPPAPENAKSGLYRSVRDRSIIKVGSADGTVTFDGRPVDLNVRFTGDKMILHNPVYGDDVWERVEQSASANLSTFAGIYTSDEAETVFRVVFENGKLVMHRRPDQRFVLKPTDADEFTCSLGSVRFLRDASRKIVAFSLSGSRMWDLRFSRENPGVTVPPQ